MGKGRRRTGAVEHCVWLRHGPRYHAAYYDALTRNTLQPRPAAPPGLLPEPADPVDEQWRLRDIEQKKRDRCQNTLTD